MDEEKGEKISLLLQYDPHNHSEEQLDEMKKALGEKFIVEDREIFRASAIPPTYVTIILEPLSIALITTAVIAGKKWIELFAEDLYHCAKKFLKGFRKPKAGDVPTLGFECTLDEVSILGYVQTDEENLLDYIFKNSIKDFLLFGSKIIKTRRLISDQPLVNMYGKDILNPGDKLPENLKEIRLSFHIETKGWKIQYISTTDTQMYMVKN